MPRVTITRRRTDHRTLDIEIARLRDLGTKELRARWRMVFRRDAPSHLPRHLLFRMLAYRLQANTFGDLDRECQRLLERTALPDADRNPTGAEPKSIRSNLPQGAILSREWNGRIHRVVVLADGFAWSGKTYASLSKVAIEITGTRWNGPRFFGLRDKSEATSGSSS